MPRPVPSTTSLSAWLAAGRAEASLRAPPSPNPRLKLRLSPVIMGEPFSRSGLRDGPHPSHFFLHIIVCNHSNPQEKGHDSQVKSSVKGRNVRCRFFGEKILAFCGFRFFLGHWLGSMSSALTPIAPQAGRRAQQRVGRVSCR